MSEAKFTKGPWVVGVRNCNDNHDANLIAAAPKLYNALERLIISNFEPTIDEIEAAQSALAEARGEHEQ